jgi:uncharacterized protein YceK
MSKKILILAIVATIYASGCASVVKGSLSGICEQQCMQTYPDYQVLKECRARCQGPK